VRRILETKRNLALLYGAEPPQLYFAPFYRKIAGANNPLDFIILNKGQNGFLSQFGCQHIITPPMLKV
jgi:hypothetical protein